MRFLALVLLLPFMMPAQVPLIIDTDAGADDLLALLWLIRQPSVQIEAVTVTQGLAHPAEGAQSVLRLLEAGGRTAVPVYIGADRPVQGYGAFPDVWRAASDRLLRDELPQAKRRPESRAAAAFLADRMMDTRRPVRILALGPLTNIGQAMALEPRTGQGLRELVWMGGALDVPGNVPQAPSAEWNAWVDPEAAERVLGGGFRVHIVPLDATNRVPIGPSMLKLFEEEAREWAATIVLRLLRSEAESIRAGRYYAWDVLAAMTLFEPKLTGQRMAALAVRKRPRERGRLVRVEGARPNAMIATSADAQLFARMFRTMLP
ncbi:MAG: nucleoside hydrolase [Acidobacteria bacterium]|nr:nucleoside hydrolase [Acidobacteriota bacterium]